MAKKSKPSKPPLQKMGSADHSALICLKRVFRWTFAFITNDTTLTQEQWVKSLVLPEYVIQREQGRVTKKGWTSLTVIFYDVARQNKELWDWVLSRPYEPTAATLKYFDGCGRLLEELIFQLTPTRVSLSNLDYASSDESHITVEFSVNSVERIIPELNHTNPVPESPRRCDS